MQGIYANAQLSKTTNRDTWHEHVYPICVVVVSDGVKSVSENMSWNWNTSLEIEK